MWQGLDAAELRRYIYITPTETRTMHTLNIVYRTGEVVRISCAEHDAIRAVRELSARADVVRAWHEAA